MIVSAQMEGADGLADRLFRTLAPRLTTQAVTSAADVIARAAAQEGVMVEVQATGDAVRIGTDDPQAVAREIGTLEAPATPWLQPLLSGLRRRP